MKISQQFFEIQRRSDGGSFQLQAIDIDSGREGPMVYIQAGLHGNELQGNATLFELCKILPSLQWRGRIRLIPVANPLGTSQKIGDFTSGRFDPISGDNYNRACFEVAPPKERLNDTDLQIDLSSFIQNYAKASEEIIIKEYKNLIAQKLQQRLKNPMGYPQKLAATLQWLASQADIVLDLHTAPIATHYLYTTEKNLKHAKHFHFPFYLLMNDEFASAMDESVSAPWWELARSFATNGREIDFPFQGYTLELASEEVFDLNQGKIEAEKIFHFLQAQKIINASESSFFMKSSQEQYACKLEHFITLHAPTGGLFNFNARPGETKMKGELLGTFINWRALETSETLNLQPMTTELKAPQDLIIINRFSSCSIPEGADVYQVMTNYWKL